MVDLVLKKMDEDRDGKISESDYVCTVKKEGLLLEAFGHCLPDPSVCKMVLGWQGEVVKSKRGRVR